MSTLIAVIGGLGVFILAVSMMTDGLKQAAGSSLRALLAVWTSSARRGVFSGFLMTAIVQSSSAVTVATIGFVNAGLLTVRQALGVVYGSNVGTTITGWLVVLTGLKVDIHAIALPLIGIGMFIRMVNKEGKFPSIGLAIAGFGLFFLGIDILKGAFETLAVNFELSQVSADGFQGVLMFLFVGIVMTVVTQSSSASIALTITASTAGVIHIDAAASMVIGANVGTTSTAIIATIGATPNAKRVALAQVLFNVSTGMIALLLFPVMFMFIHGFSQLFYLSTEPSVALALFHTVFNILGVLIILPVNNRLANFLESRFVSYQSEPSKLKYLDKTLVNTPVLAVNALILELRSMAKRVLELTNVCSSKEKIALPYVYSQQEIIKHLSAEISRFIVHIERNTISQETASQLLILMRVDEYLLSCANNLVLTSEQKKQLSELGVSELNSTKSFESFIISVFNRPYSLDVEHSLRESQSKHDEAKASLLSESVAGNISFHGLANALEFLAKQLRMTQQWLKATRLLKKLELETETIDKIGEGEIDVADIKDGDAELNDKLSNRQIN
ncbi:Na/Pi cotransporter family protein [Pleionea sediminis]|uniref:Na/Pi cotransporter family protein n=1 Tax=Pleionea sediminis TaxID=2569479 RepID=UPI001186F940|nr:Na/Pi cotransporter family protein [Pleionea sediminis]